MRLRATKLSAIGFGGSRAALPSLDLAFATDKTLTARRGPTPTFTRGSGATQVNAAGLIEYAPENLILFSNSITSPAWTKEGGTAASSIETVNGLTASVFNEDSANSTHRFYRLNDGLAGITSTFSVWLKAAGRRYVCVNLGSNGPTVNSKPVIDLVDRVVVAGVAGVTINIQLEANGWARYSFTFVPRSDSGTMPIQSNFSSTTLSEIGVGLNGAAFYVAGQQYERFSSARTYRPTTTDAAYSPRFDHDPVTLACKGLLIEEQRTNALQHSANFKNTTSSNYWENLSATTVTVDQIASPDGGVNADLLTTSTASFDCFVRRTGIFTGSTQYTYSIFLKQGPSGYRYVGLYIGAGVSALKFPFFDFNNPTTVQIPSGTMVGTINSTRVDAYPNGWYRVSVTFTTAATPVTTLCGVYISQSDGTIPASSAAGLNAYIWGIQVELGSFPTSYIPTTTTALTRSADVCSITGGDFTSFSSTVGFTALCNFSLLATATAGAMAPIAVNQSAANGVFLYKGITSSDLTVYHVSTNTSIGSVTANFTYKAAMAYDGDSVVGVLSGGSVSVETGSTALSFTGITIGSNRSSAHQMSGHIARIQYFKKRLPNAKLQSITS